MKYGKAILAAAAGALTALAAGCVTTECTRVGQVIWQKEANPDRDAPRWVRNERAAAREAKIRLAAVPQRYVMFRGVSQDLNEERGARFAAMDDMLKRYAAYLQGQLDRLLSRAADEAGVRLAEVNTALGSARTVDFLQRERVDREIVRASWQARGQRCLEGGSEPVYRVYLLGVFERKLTRELVVEAAREALSFALVNRQQRDGVLAKIEELAAGM